MLREAWTDRILYIETCISWVIVFVVFKSIFRELWKLIFGLCFLIREKQSYVAWLSDKTSLIPPHLTQNLCQLPVIWSQVEITTSIKRILETNSNWMKRWEIWNQFNMWQDLATKSYLPAGMCVHGVGKSIWKWRGDRRTLGVIIGNLVMKRPPLESSWNWCEQKKTLWL